MTRPYPSTVVFDDESLRHVVVGIGGRVLGADAKAVHAEIVVANLGSAGIARLWGQVLPIGPNRARVSTRALGRVIVEAIEALVPPGSHLKMFRRIDTRVLPVRIRLRAHAACGRLVARVDRLEDAQPRFRRRGGGVERAQVIAQARTQASLAVDVEVFERDGSTGQARLPSIAARMAPVRDTHPAADDRFLAGKALIDDFSLRRTAVGKVELHRVGNRIDAAPEDHVDLRHRCDRRCERSPGRGRTS